MIVLVKEYDRVDWNFLRFILIHIGLSIKVTSWIMACISLVNFAILVNGSPTSSFNNNRGLKKRIPVISLSIFACY